MAELVMAAGVLFSIREKAAEFDELARSTSEPTLKERYGDVAESYRLLAIVRQRLIETGALEPEQP